MGDLIQSNRARSVRVWSRWVCQPNNLVGSRLELAVSNSIDRVWRWIGLALNWARPGWRSVSNRGPRRSSLV